MHMIAPVSAGTDRVVRVTNSIQMMPASAAGSAVMITNGSSHDWKFTHDQQIDQHDRPQQPEGQSREGGVHGGDLPAQGDNGAARRFVGRLLDQALNVSGDAAEVTILRRGEQVDHRLHVVVAGHGAGLLAGDLAKAAPGPARRCRGHRRSPGCSPAPSGYRPDTRGFGRRWVGDAVLAIEPEHWRGLRAAGQRRGHAVGHVEFGQPELGDARAIDIDPQLGIVRSTAACEDRRSLECSACGATGSSAIGLIGLLVWSDDLDVQRRGASRNLGSG